MPDGEQQGGGVELSVTEKARTLLEDGCARVSVAHDVAVASRQRHNEGRRRRGLRITDRAPGGGVPGRRA